MAVYVPTSLSIACGYYKYRKISGDRRRKSEVRRQETGTPLPK